jgi:hypothetical protein
MPTLDLTGQRFGRLTVFKDTGKKYKEGSILYLCKCYCNQKVIVSSWNLRSGNTKSCGCLQKEAAVKIGKIYGPVNGKTNALIMGKKWGVINGKLRKTHGQSGYRKKATCEYVTWCGMKQRCLDSKFPNYKNYGGRGIQICS